MLASVLITHAWDAQFRSKCSFTYSLLIVLCNIDINTRSQRPFLTRTYIHTFDMLLHAFLNSAHYCTYSQFAFRLYWKQLICLYFVTWFKLIVPTFYSLWQTICKYWHDRFDSWAISSHDKSQSIKTFYSSNNFYSTKSMHHF